MLIKIKEALRIEQKGINYLVPKELKQYDIIELLTKVNIKNN